MGRAVRTVRLHLRLWAPFAFLALFFFVPLARTLALGIGADWSWLATPYVLRRLESAFLQAILSVLLTMALASALAWHHHRRALPWSRLHLALHAAPFVLPVFVVAFGVRDLLALLGWGAPLGAVVVAHAYYNYGFAARILHADLERRPHRLEAAARTLGASPWQAFRRVTLPLLAPSFAAVALLVFLFSFTSFGVVLFLGENQVHTLETLLYFQMGGAFRRLDRAAMLGVLQLAINLALLVAYGLLRRRQRLASEIHRPLPARPVDRAVQVLALLAGLSPAAMVLVGGFRVRGEWTLEAWRAITDATHPSHLAGFNLWAALDRSLFYAFWSALLAIALTLALAYGVRRMPRGRRLVEALAALPLGTSSLLIGFGFVITFGAGAFWDLRGSLLQIVLAHTLVAFPFTARTLVPALDQHDTRLDEAARLLGATPWQVVRRIHWPLLRAPLLVAVGMAVAISFGDFGASLLLMRQENMALSVWIGQHDQPFRLLMKAQATALSSVLMVLAAASYVLVERFR